ncbi:MAG: hypothetical protein WBM69_16145, partial [Desulfobacterales bacterium]
TTRVCLRLGFKSDRKNILIIKGGLDRRSGFPAAIRFVSAILIAALALRSRDASKSRAHRGLYQRNMGEW